MENIIEISRWICLGWLIGMSVIDVKYRAIPTIALGIFFIAAVLCQMTVIHENKYLLLGGAGVGAIFIIVGKLTGESIGYGDGAGILNLGVYLGLWKVLEVLTAVFFVMAVVVIVVLVRQHLSRKAAVPFYPVLTVGYFIWMTAGGGVMGG